MMHLKEEVSLKFDKKEKYAYAFGKSSDYR